MYTNKMKRLGDIKGLGELGILPILAAALPVVTSVLPSLFSFFGGKSAGEQAKDIARIQSQTAIRQAELQAQVATTQYKTGLLAQLASSQQQSGISIPGIGPLSTTTLLMVGGGVVALILILKKK